MAHAISGKHDATAFVFGILPSSRLGDSSGDSRRSSTGPRTPSSRIFEACLWAVGLAAGTLGNAVVFVDPSALARWSTVFDRVEVTWAVAILGYIFIGRSAPIAPVAFKGRDYRLASVLSLVAWTYHLYCLRWPWLVAQYAPGDRLTVYCGSLSRTFRHIPIYALGELLAMALLFTHAGLFFLAASKGKGWLQTDNTERIFWRYVALIALTIYSVSAAITVAFGTGRI
jgi:hypothetical protein